MVLGDHVEVLRQGTLGDKAEPSCTQITGQGPLRCEATKLGTEPRAGVGCHDKICNLVCRAPIGLVGPQGRPGRPAGQAVQELGSRLAVVEKMSSEGGTSAWLVIAPCVLPILVADQESKCLSFVEHNRVLGSRLPILVLLSSAQLFQFWSMRLATHDLI